MIYFISDMHLRHTNIIKFCHRPFTDTEEMEKTIIENWNNIVTDNDIVYNLGDITLGNASVIHDVLPKLKGKQILIYGNHEYWSKTASTHKYFDSMQKEKVIEIEHNGKLLKVLLTHFPKPIEDADYDYIIYGHIHNNEPDPYWLYQQTHANVLNACVEVNDYRPVTFEQLIENNRKIKDPGVL